eukprot:s27_g55.t1
MSLWQRINLSKKTRSNQPRLYHLLRDPVSITTAPLHRKDGRKKFRASDQTPWHQPGEPQMCGAVVQNLKSNVSGWRYSQETPREPNFFKRKLVVFPVFCDLGPHHK